MKRLSLILLLSLFAGSIWAGSTFVAIDKPPPKKVHTVPTPVYKTCPICGECYPQVPYSPLGHGMGVTPAYCTYELQCQKTKKTFEHKQWRNTRIIWGKYVKDTIESSIDSTKGEKE